MYCIGIFCISVYAFFDIAIVLLDNFFLYRSTNLRMLGAIKRNSKMVGYRLSFVDKKQKLENGGVLSRHSVVTMVTDMTS